VQLDAFRTAFDTLWIRFVLLDKCNGGYRNCVCNSACPHKFRPCCIVINCCMALPSRKHQCKHFDRVCYKQLKWNVSFRLASLTLFHVIVSSINYMTQRWVILKPQFVTMQVLFSAGWYKSSSHWRVKYFMVTGREIRFNNTHIKDSMRIMIGWHPVCWSCSLCKDVLYVTD